MVVMTMMMLMLIWSPDKHKQIVKKLVTMSITLCDANTRCTDIENDNRE